ncbi:toll-like receptor 2 [Pleuronectes platessa]|uniref:toll-like receptor 2 n=1 Tax=Pleuronectes platessa TaxID=8262 RepID=UPI00232A1DD6|nr:toll-like receptor 2 [Pleuronectes platessa]
MKILTFLVLMPLMHQSFSLSSPQCHFCDETSWNCSNQNLRKVPAAPPQHITQLDLSFNTVETIMQGDFLTYASLRSLILTHNKIKTIQGRAFVPLTHLETLDLSMNQLAALSADWFKNLFSLQHLNLLGNRYKTLGEVDLFQPLKKLKTLQFGGPDLQSVRETDFSGLSGLQELVFDGKNLLNYTEGSLRRIGPISRVTLGLNGSFNRNPTLVEAVLSDVAHPTTTLTFTETDFISKYEMYPLQVAFNGGITHIIFRNIIMTTAASMALLKILPDSNISTLALEDAKLHLLPLGDIWMIPNSFQLEVAVFKNVDVPEFLKFPPVFFLLRGVRRVSLQNSKVFALPCESTADFPKLEYMDVSDNFFSDLALSNMMCDGRGGLWSLRTLNVSGNHLRSLNSHLFTKLENLTNIDMSGNMLHVMPETCNWPPSLTFLNLSSTHLTKVTSCLPPSLHTLDLSNNELSMFNVGLPLLTELYINGNKIKSLPVGRLYPRLVAIFIHNNNLQTFSRNDLNAFDSLKSLEAAGNTYICSCDFVELVTSGLTKHGVRIEDGLKSYICNSPDASRGTSVADVRLSAFECQAALSISLLCLGLLVVCLLIAGLCHKYNAAWYMEMIWAWLRAKRKPKLKKGALEYDAFVSYSEMDSGWVDAHLVPELEQSEPPLRLCLHKRDFHPGGWIMDNIMDAVEKSRKTLFVLSQHFVQSEWCKYELDYTHFRWFDQNDDTVVLILLEPIDKETIPKKFCRLRRVMNSRTYLEWPDDDNMVERFWQSLRAAIKDQ